MLYVYVCVCIFMYMYMYMYMYLTAVGLLWCFVMAGREACGMSVQELFAGCVLALEALEELWECQYGLCKETSDKAKWGRYVIFMSFGRQDRNWGATNCCL